MSLHPFFVLMWLCICSVSFQFSLCVTKSCLAQNFHRGAISAEEFCYQLASVHSYLSSPLSALCCVFSPPLWTQLFISSICIAASLPPSSVCLCRSVCLYSLTPSSLPSQHCSSRLPESQTHRCRCLSRPTPSHLKQYGGSAWEERVSEEMDKKMRKR